MALEDLIEEVDPRERDDHCPECGTKGEETERIEIKCIDDDCDVMNWYPS